MAERRQSASGPAAATSPTCASNLGGGDERQAVKALGSAAASSGRSYWVSSNRAVMVTVSLSSPASIGVGADAPAVYAREKATGGWRPASSVSTMSRPILAPPALA